MESFGERTVAIALGKLKLRFVCQKSFHDCKDVHRLRFDFFLPELKTLIEFDGQHHFQPIEGWRGDTAHLQVLRRDRIKTEWAKLNGYRLLRIPYTESDIMGFLSGELSFVNHPSHEPFVVRFHRSLQRVAIEDATLKDDPRMHQKLPL